MMNHQDGISREDLQMMQMERIMHYDRVHGLHQCQHACTMQDVDFDPEPFPLVRANLLYLNIVHSYYDESRRMSDVSQRCSHHLPEFNNDSKKFISFVMNVIYKPMKEPADNTMYRGTKSQNDLIHDVMEFTGNGICQNCAYHLATELPGFLWRLNKRYKCRM